MIMTKDFKMDKWLNAGEIVTSFDVETKPTGLGSALEPYRGAKIFSYCIGWPDGEVDVLRLDDIVSERQRLFGWDYLKRYMRHTKFIKTAHSYKMEYSFLKTHGKEMGVIIPDNTVWDDTMLLAKCYRNDYLKYDLGYITWLLCKDKEWNEYCKRIDTEVERQAKMRGDHRGERYDLVDPELMYEYQVIDGQRPLLVREVFFPEISKSPRRFEDYMVEVELVKPTQMMEEHGIKLESSEVDKMRKILKAEVAKQEKIIYSFPEVPKGINLNSGKQLQNLLYDRFGFPILKKSAKSDAPSTDKNVLFALRDSTGHPVIEALLRRKAYTKELADIDGYERCVDEEGMLHPNIKTNFADTGRESSENPSMMNVVKGVGIKTPYSISLRSLFRMPYGEYLVAADYAQIELRIIVELTQQPKLMKVLLSDGDIHHSTVQCFLGAGEADWLRDNDKKKYKMYRDAMKNVGFGIAYGSGLATIAMTMAMPISEVAPGLAIYRKEFPEISNFSRAMIEQVKEFGYVETPFGRILNVSRSDAFAGSNYKVQGTAAGVFKRAQINVYNLIKKKYDGDVWLTLPIHDEIMKSFSRRVIRYEKEIMRDFSNAMIDIPYITVPLKVEYKKSMTTWDKCQGVEFNIAA